MEEAVLLILKVVVNKPEDETILQDALCKTLAQILVRKLGPKGTDKLLELLKNDDVELKL